MTQRQAFSAFPRPKFYPTDGDPDHDGIEQGGMSLRDYFAGQVLAGLLNNDDMVQRVLETAQGNQPPHAPGKFKIAAFCYSIADIMLETRSGS